MTGNMIRATANTCVAVGLVFLGALAPSQADLPVHCLRDDVAGEWTFHFTDTQPPGLVPDLPSNQQGQAFCQHVAPNMNGDNLRMFDKPGMNEIGAMASSLGAHQNVHVTLATTPTTGGLHAQMQSGEEGQWTMIYDEGLHVELPVGGSRLSFFAFSYYQCADGNAKCGGESDSESTDGTTAGYRSMCGQTHVGWYASTHPKTGVAQGFGCWVGHKKEAAASSMAHAYVLLSNKQHKVLSPVLVDAMGQTTSSVVTRSLVSKRGTSLAQAVASVCNLDEQVEAVLTQSGAGVPASLPTDFLWQSATTAVAADKVSEGWFVDPEARPADQGTCGSCYAMAMTYAFQARINIALQKRGINSPVVLSPESVLQCSYTNQRCSGGYPELVAHHARHFGMANSDCQPYNEGKDTKCNSECYAKSEKLWFAKDWGYVGGFYGECGEQKMMQSVYEAGPVAVALEWSEEGMAALTSGGTFVHPHVGAELSPVQLSVQVVPTVSLMEVAESEQRIMRQEGKQQGVMAVDGAGAVDTVAQLQREVTRWLASSLQDRASELRKSPKLFSLLADNGGDALVLRSDAVAAALSTTTLDAVLNDIRVELATLFTKHIASVSTTKLLSDTGATLAAQLQPQNLKLRVEHAGVHGWEYTNHAVVVTGWGVEPDSQQKYWMVRNSWGEDWNGGGYVKIPRGINAMGIEAQSVFANPDFSRGAGQALVRA